MLKGLRRSLVEVAHSIVNTRSGVLRRLCYDANDGPYAVYNGRETYLVKTSDKVIGRQVYQTGDFELWKLEVALSICRKNGIKVSSIVDIGANIGTTIIPAIYRGWVSHGIAVEPHPENVKLLEINALLNGVSLQIHQCAASSCDGESFLIESGSNSGDHRIGASGVKVRLATLDSILTAPIGDELIWIDVQGHESSVLQGAKLAIGAGCPIVFEFSPEYLTPTDAVEISRELSGRTFFNIKSREVVLDLPKLLDDLKGNPYTDILAINLTI